jgi:hypothetical protein
MTFNSNGLASELRNGYIVSERGREEHTGKER